MSESMDPLVSITGLRVPVLVHLAREACGLQGFEGLEKALA